MPCGCRCTPAVRRAWRAEPSVGRVAESTVAGAGRGLFATRDHSSAEFVTFYSGCLLDGDEHEGDRMLEFEPGRSVDGDGPCRLACADGDMMNHARRPNCRYKLDRDTVPGETLVRIVTTRSVPRGAEFFTNYGPCFQFNV